MALAEARFLKLRGIVLSDSRPLQRPFRSRPTERDRG
jgi:hypothetical protein